VTTYVLVGGAWIGGWAWKPVARQLRARGHDVYPVTLTGLGERAHLARPDVDLETHITDVVNVLAYEDLTDVILVGHSYAAIVVTGVADRAAERLAQLVYLDSAPLRDGDSLLDLFPPAAAAQLQRQVDEVGAGWRLQFPTFEELAMTASLTGLDEAERELMQAKAVAQPFRTYTQPLRLTGAGRDDFKTARFAWVAIACEEMQALTESGPPQLQALRAAPWSFHELPTGHWPMLSTPDELAALLHGLAGQP
jgi:pimeloyl-ACP methyl ester carboxylesterase